MLKRITYFALSALIFIASLLSFSGTAVYAQIDPTGEACAALGAASGTPGECEDPNAAPKVDDTIELAINVFSLIVGVAAVIMIMVGGFKYITSSGDSSNITGAKNTILYAIIGLVVVALAQVIVKFVIEKTP